MDACTSPFGCEHGWMHCLHEAVFKPMDYPIFTGHVMSKPRLLEDCLKRTTQRTCMHFFVLVCSLEGSMEEAEAKAACLAGQAGIAVRSSNWDQGNACSIL